MKLEKLVGERFRERPSDCIVDSHALMMRGGYMKYVANGIFSSYMPLKRVTRKIEQIIREEMDAIDGQEVQFPVVMPRPCGRSPADMTASAKRWPVSVTAAAARSSSA